MVKELKTFSELEDILMKIPDSQLVILDCFATWCGPCKRFAPIFEKLEEKYPKVLFLKANVEKIEELSTEFKVTSMPTFIYLKDVCVVGKITGTNTSEIESTIKRLI